MKTIPYWIILILAGVVTYLLLSKPEEFDSTPYQNTIDSLRAENVVLFKKNDSLDRKLHIKQTQQDYLESEIDSLKTAYNSKPKAPCRHKVAQLENIVYVQDLALKKCKEQKPIYSQRKANYEKVIINYQAELHTSAQMWDSHKEILKRNSKKSFKKGLFVGGGGVGLLVLIILLL